MKRIKVSIPIILLICSLLNYATRKWTTKEILEQVKNTIREIRGEKNAEC